MVSYSLTHREYLHSIRISKMLSYDRAGNLLAVAECLNGKEETSYTYEYDENLRLTIFFRKKALCIIGIAFLISQGGKNCGNAVSFIIGITSGPS